MIKKEYLNSEGKHHREDGPAVIFDDGTTFWCLNGLAHRIGGPAEEYADGEKCWYLNGKRHRIDGPAQIFDDGETIWYRNGKMHRIDGPAMECDRKKVWYVDGVVHRTDGPAWISEYSVWYHHGAEHRDFGLPSCVWKNGNSEWYFNNTKVGKQKSLDLAINLREIKFGLFVCFFDLNEDDLFYLFTLNWK